MSDQVGWWEGRGWDRRVLWGTKAASAQTELRFRLIVRDPDGRFDTDFVHIIVNGPPTANAGPDTTSSSRRPCAALSRCSPHATASNPHAIHQAPSLAPRRMQNC